MTSKTVPPETDLKKIQGRFSPASILWVTILGIALAEVIAMIVVYFFQHLPYYQQVLIDAGLMTVIIFPILYYLSFRPILQHIEMRRQAEDDLRNAYDDLELRVQARTEDLRQANLELSDEVTVRKQAEGRLCSSEERYRSLFNSMTEGFALHEVICDDSGLPCDYQFLELNPSFERMTGLKRETTIGRTVKEVLPGLESRWIETYGTVALTGQPIQLVDYTASLKKWYEIYCYSPAKNQFATLFFDITESKKTEEVLERFQLLSEHSRDIILFMRYQDGHILEANTAATQAYGYTHDQLLALNISDLRDINTKGLTGEQMAQANAGGILFETVHRHKDGSSFPVEVSSQGATIGGVRTLVSIVRDITERKQVEGELERSNQKLNEILTSIQDDFYVLDRDWNFVYANPLFTVKVGKKPENFVGNNIWTMFPNHIGTILEENFRAAMEKREVRRFELSEKYTDAWYRMTVFPSTEGITVLGTDITERKKVEDALRLSEENFTKAFMLSPTALMITRLDGGEYLESNDAYCRLIGYDQAEIRGHRTTDFNIFIHPNDHKAIVDQLLAAGSIRDYESKIRHRSGDVRHVVASQELITFNGENCILTTLQDITELKRADEILHKLNRTLRALTNTNQAMIRSTSEKQCLEDACKIVVEDCGHSMVWIGYAQEDELKSVLPVAFAGFEDGYLESLNISWAYTERGQGPTGTAIRTGKPSRCDNILTDPSFAPWRAQAVKHGYASSLVLPLISESKAFGAISIYSREPDFFPQEEEALLTELAGDLAYGIQAIRLREAHAQVEAQLQIAHDELELRIQERTAELADLVQDLSNEISERMKIERQLLIQTTAMEAAANGIVITDPDGIILWVNPALIALSGYAEEEILGQPMNLFSSGKQDQDFYRQMWAVILAGQMWQGEIVNRRKDGSLYIEQQTIAPVIGEAGKISHFIAIKHDITEQKQAAEAQRKSDEKFRILADWTYDWELWIDPDAKIIYTSPSSERITGYGPEEFMANPDLLLAIVHSDDKAAFIDHHYRVHDKGIGVMSSEFRVMRRDGRVCWIEHVCRPLFDAENRYLGRRISNRDISERKKIEAEIQERNRREKQLIQMLHTTQLEIARDLHDTIGQNIGYLRMKLDYLDEKSPPYREQDLKAELSRMTQVANESYDLVRGTLAILQVKGPSDLIQLFKKYADQIVERSELRVEFNNSGDAGELSAHQMRQIFYIFREALSNIEKHSGASQARVDVRWEIDTLTISIQDNGSGFDPLTTPTYGGHYGLKFMRERTEMMDGSLLITAEPGAGTHLLISIPVRGSQMVA